MTQLPPIALELKKWIHLEKEYKYFKSIWYESKPKTACFLLLSNSHLEPLGFVKWYAPWRQYCFYPMKDTVFSKGCLKDIQDYLELLMNDRKEESQTE